MKALLLSGFVIALLTGGAFAQASGQPPTPPTPGMAAPPPPAPGLAPPPPPPPGAAAPSVGPGAEAGDMAALRRLRLPGALVLEVSGRRPRRNGRRISACSAATR
jgi:hypothetical protein